MGLTLATFPRARCAAEAMHILRFVLRQTDLQSSNQRVTPCKRRIYSYSDTTPIMNHWICDALTILVYSHLHHEGDVWVVHTSRGHVRREHNLFGVPPEPVLGENMCVYAYVYIYVCL